MAFKFIQKLKQGLTRTRENLSSTLQSVVGRKEIDESTLEELEYALIGADLGPELADEVIAAIRKQAKKSGETGEGLRAAVRQTLRAALPDAEPIPVQGPPHVIFVVGVNGGGKTTTVGKLAAKDSAAGLKTMVVAADTFRAAAIEQLQTWAERSGAEFMHQKEGSDPASVVFDALKAAKARGTQRVYVDTAGRLHTKTNLMAELSKLGRIAGREVEGAPHEVLLIVDATTGQNGLAQAKEFTHATELTGVVLTKLDGTAKGGVALAIHRALGVPIRHVGVGEAVDDLLDFDPDAFIDGLVGSAKSTAAEEATD